MSDVIEAMARAVSDVHDPELWDQTNDNWKILKRDEVRAALRAAEAMGWKLTSQHASARMIASGLDKQLPDGSHSLLVVWRAMHAAAPALGGDDASATVPECSE